MLISVKSLDKGFDYESDNNDSGNMATWSKITTATVPKFFEKTNPQHNSTP